MSDINKLKKLGSEHWRRTRPYDTSRTVSCSEALPVDNGWARLVILALRDPHLLERAQRRQDGATNPHGILALRWCNNLDLHGGWGQCRQLLGHALANSCKHRGATGQHNVAVQVLADIHITLHDGLEGGVVDATGLLAHEAG